MVHDTILDGWVVDGGGGVDTGTTRPLFCTGGSHVEEGPVMVWLMVVVGWTQALHALFFCTGGSHVEEGPVMVWVVLFRSTLALRC